MHEILEAIVSELRLKGYEFRIDGGFGSNVHGVHNEKLYARVYAFDDDDEIHVVVFNLLESDKFRRTANFDVANPDFSVESIIKFLNQEGEWERY